MTTVPIVSNISDTARWVAVYRAMESRRADALFHDPFAERLAGERGEKIANHLSSPRRHSWPMVVRTKLIDDLVLECIKEGCDRVLNLAAGLDSRPYRLPLPSTLGWVEADLPAMIEEKNRLLAADKPVCALSREAVDLADGAARTAFLTRALAGAKKALVLTEGLLVYLPAATVAELGRDLHAQPSVAWWMMDLASPAVLKMMQRRVNHKLGDDAKMVFGPRDGVAFFAPLGWKPREVRSMFKAAHELHRLPFFLDLIARVAKDPPPDNPGDRF